MLKVEKITKLGYICHNNIEYDQTKMKSLHKVLPSTKCSYDLRRRSTIASCQ